MRKEYAGASLPSPLAGTVTKDAVDGKEKPEVVYRDVTVPKKALAGRSRKESNGEIA